MANYFDMTVVDRIEILEDGSLQVREAKRIVNSDTGKVAGQTFNRYVITPLDEVSPLSADRVKDVAAAVHTAQCKAAYQAKMRANENSPL